MYFVWRFKELKSKYEIKIFDINYCINNIRSGCHIFVVVAILILPQWFIRNEDDFFNCCLFIFISFFIRKKKTNLAITKSRVLRNKSFKFSSRFSPFFYQRNIIHLFIYLNHFIS